VVGIKSPWDAVDPIYYLFASFNNRKVDYAVQIEDGQIDQNKAIDVI